VEQAYLTLADTVAGPSGPDNLFNYLLLGAFLFALGIFCMITRRNAIGVLMGVELILNAAGVNFVAFSRFGNRMGDSPGFDGQIFTLFIVVLAAAEAAVALALVLAVFQNRHSIDVTQADELKW